MAKDKKELPVPQERKDRERMRNLARDYVADRSLIPPLSMEELLLHVRAIIRADKASRPYQDYMMVLLSNEIWRDTVASVPYERRILLLPQCLRNSETCPGELDEIGLLCVQCGRCATGDLQAEAEELGYVVLVAEGTTVVTKLLEQGKVDAVVGVSCLSTLERSFPYMSADAIPGVAIPLHVAGCESTKVDLDWVREAIALRSEGGWSGRFDLDKIRAEVQGWFSPDCLQAIVEHNGTRTEEIAFSWLSEEGKRWRPYLAVCVFKALNTLEADVPEMMRKLACAVECFHKASLVHDDIEDNDDERYGEMTLHKRNGIPIALNVGDLLLGEGYRLIAESGASSEQVVQMLLVASKGHRTLCLGQGEELCWMRSPQPLSSQKVIEIFSRKTAPAFDVALQFGALSAGSNGRVCKVLDCFSEALGIAYQIRDDLEDFHGEGGDALAMRPSLMLALGWEHADEATRAIISAGWSPTASEQAVRLASDAVVELCVEEKAHQLLEHYKNEAIRSLAPLQSASLKSLLRRIVGKILGRG